MAAKHPNAGAQRLEQVMAARNWKQKDVARETGVRQPALSLLLNEEKLASRRQALALWKIGIDPSLWDLPRVEAPPSKKGAA